jgi:Arc/MetJ-type ribon-helix-helix transcriptional regulator
MRAKTVGFAIADEDRELLDRLVAKYGEGNRSEFLRKAMQMMAKMEFAERFNGILDDIQQELGGKQYSSDEVLALIEEVRAEKRA